MTKLEKLIARIPKFMHLEVDRIETLDDLLLQVQHEIDLAEEGDLQWTKRQMQRAKTFHATVDLHQGMNAIEAERRNHEHQTTLAAWSHYSRA
jgi:hypothetical protein